MFGKPKPQPTQRPPQKADTAYLSPLRAAQVVDATPRTSWALYLMALVMITAAIWASFTRVDEITRADARVVPDGREQVIASLEGGILRELQVREGMQVEAGQDLAQIDPTRFESQQNEGQAKRLAVKATIARLAAEATGGALKFPADVVAAPGMVEAETASFNARKRSLSEAVGSTHRSVALLQRELDMAQRMSDQGLMSNVEVMRLRRQVNDLELQAQERTNRFRQDASTDLVRVQTEMAQINEQITGRADVLRRTVLKSPVRGLVKNIRIATIGGVIAPGAPVMEIVPIGNRILIEARIKPSAIGFVRVGQHVEVKLSAYDFSIYGGLEASVETITADSITNEKGESFYLVRVRTATNSMGSVDKQLTIIPGMLATVHIRTGKKSVLGYLLKPVIKAKYDALRER